MSCRSLVQPIEIVPSRRLSAYGRVALPCNYWYRLILGLLAKLDCLRSCEGRIRKVTAGITDEPSLIRAADENARYTFVENTGNAVVYIYEDNELVAIVSPGEERRLPLHGRLELTGATEDAGTVSEVECTTYEFCVCGPLPGFVIFLCLDQTGSIGVGGAQRGVEIIDQFSGAVGREQIHGIGYVSFGDIICQLQEITDDLDGVKSELQAAIDDPSGSLFFQDGGGDTPENGVDALAVAIEQLQDSELAKRASYRYIAMITDTAGFAHNTNAPSIVNDELDSSPVTRAWLEFNSANTAAEDEGEYSTAFPESDIVVHGAFNIQEG